MSYTFCILAVMTKELCREYREKNGLGQKDLGKLVGRSKKTIWCWENGVTTPEPPDAMKLESITGGYIPFRGWYGNAS